MPKLWVPKGYRRMHREDLLRLKIRVGSKVLTDYKPAGSGGPGHLNEVEVTQIEIYSPGNPLLSPSGGVRLTVQDTRCPHCGSFPVSGNGRLVGLSIEWFLVPTRRKKA
jgi:hypothetical protein